jgi:hypothetical protein
LPGIPNLVSGNLSYTVNHDGSGYFTDLNAAISYFSKNLIDTSTNTGYTLQLDAATHNYSTFVETQSPFTKMVTVQGATPITTTMSSVVSSSGSSGNYSLVLQLASVAGIAVGQVCVVQSPSGGTNPSYLEGPWLITAVNASSNQITVTCKCRNATPPSGAISANITVLTSVINFSGCNGFEIFSGGSSLNLVNVAIVGNNSGSYSGIDLQDLGRVYINGVVAVMNFGGNNVFMNYNAEFNGDGYLYTSGAGADGIELTTGAVLDIHWLTSNGNGGNGLSCYFAQASVSNRLNLSGNAQAGFYGENFGTLYCVTTTTIYAQGNGTYGFQTVAFGNVDWGAATPNVGGNGTADYQIINTSQSGLFAGGYSNGYGGSFQGFSDGGLVQQAQYRNGVYLNAQLASVGANNGSSVTTHASYNTISTGADSLAFFQTGAHYGGIYYHANSGSSFSDNQWNAGFYLDVQDNFVALGMGAFPSGSSFSYAYNATNIIPPYQSTFAPRTLVKFFDYNAGSSNRSLYMSSNGSGFTQEFNFSTDYQSKISFGVNSGSYSTSSLPEHLTVNNNGNVTIGVGSLATSATNGFPYIPTCSGTPSSTPASFSGYAPIVFNSTTGNLNVNIGGSWYHFAATAGAG